MKVPVINDSSKTLRLVIEPLCEEYDVPIDHVAWMDVGDGASNLEIVIDDDQLTIWNMNVVPSRVEIERQKYSKPQN